MHFPSSSFSVFSQNLCLVSLALFGADKPSFIDCSITAPLHERVMACLDRNLTPGTNTIEVSNTNQNGTIMVSVSQPSAGGIVVYSTVHDSDGEPRFDLAFNPTYDTEPDGQPDAIVMMFDIQDTNPSRWTPVRDDLYPPGAKSFGLIQPAEIQRIHDLKLEVFLKFAGCIDGE